MLQNTPGEEQFSIMEYSWIIIPNELPQNTA